MVRITAVLVAGILAGIYFPSLIRPESLTVFLVILSLVYGIVHLVLIRTVALRVVSGAVGISFIWLAGYGVVWLRDESHREDALSHHPQPVQAFRVRLISAADKREHSWRLTGEVESINSGNGWMVGSGKILLYWPLSERADTLVYGDQILVKGNPQPIEGPQNPGEFDYRQFLARQNIFHQHHVKPGAWVRTETSREFGPMYFAIKARAWTIGEIDRLIANDRASAIVSAFVIGVTSGIDDELRQAYAAGGAMHALAVSGMHVSILYGVLLLMFKPLEKKRGGPWTIAMTSITLLWMYAFITGLSPSVLRAVAMFSFVALAKPLGRTTSILNTLASSAFFLLLYDPYLILSAGFQLSYLAVIGIVLLYRPIYNLAEMRWAWADWIWQITCVSIAAQIATLPVTLYYFHQFPLYFLLANLFVIPASTIILLGGILLLILSPLPVVAEWLARLLEVMVYLLNEGLFLIQQLPHSVIYPIPITLVQALCLGMLVMGGYSLFRFRKFRWVLFLATVAMVFAWEDWRFSSTQAQFIVYRVTRGSAMEWTSDQGAVRLLDSNLANDPGKIGYHLEPNRVVRRIVNVKSSVIVGNQMGARLYDFRGTSFLWVGRDSFVPQPGLRVHCVVISGNSVKSLETFIRTVNFDYVVLDGSNSYRYAEKIKSEASGLGKGCHSVLTDGAFILNL